MNDRRGALALLVPATVALCISLAPLRLDAQVADTMDLESAAMNWVDLLREGRFQDAGARIDPAAAALGLTTDQLRAIWGQFTVQLGELLELEPGEFHSSGGYEIADLMATFTNAVVTVRVVFTAEKQVSGFFIRPREGGAVARREWVVPSYVDQGAFIETEIIVGEDPWALPGSLALPVGKGPFPVAVLLHGSGPNDRNGTIGPNRVLQDLAWGLASLGVATIRYDKRTLVHGARMDGGTTLEEEVVADALAALSLARDQPGIDTDRVVLVGHSLGGMLAPRIARRDGRLAGVVILAAPARPFETVLRGQLEHLVSLGEPVEAAALDLLAALDRWNEGALEPEESPLGVPASYLEELAALNPVETLRNLDTPALLLQGGRDYQSTIEDLSLWRTGLAGRADVEFGLHPHLNHLFAPGEGMATPAEYAEPAHFDGEVVAAIARWIGGRDP